METRLQGGASGKVAEQTTAAPPRVLALHLPDFALQRVARERAGQDGGDRRAPARATGGEARPLAVAAQGRVLACDVAARALGVRPGDSAVQAAALCASLEVVEADPRADLAALHALAEVLCGLAPAVEPWLPDVLLLDASAAHLVRGGSHPSLREAERALMEEAVAVAARLGFRARAAVASGRAPARAIARFGRPVAPSDARPWERFPAGPVVPPEDTARALAPLPVEALGLGPEVCERLASLALGDVASLARLPPAALAHRFGEAGERAARLARGEDPSRLVPFVPQTLPEERLDLEGPVESAEPLLFGLRRLAERVALRLAGRGLGATKLRMALMLDPRGEERVLVPLAWPTAAVSQWLPPLKERVAGLRLPAAVTGLRLAAVEVAEAPAEQLALGQRAEQVAALEQVVARLEARLGDGALFAAEPKARYRPEGAYAPKRFGAGPAAAKAPAKKKRPVTLEEPGSARRTGGARSAQHANDAPPPPVRPTRLLPKPLPLVAEGEGGRLTALRLDGRAHRVLAFAGPERLVGEWWSEPYARDYYRVRLDGLGECWIYRDAADGRLYLHGMFD